MAITRRTFLGVGVAGAAACAAGAGGLAVTGRWDAAVVAARRRIQGCGPTEPAPPVTIGPIDTGEFTSRAMKNRQVAFKIAYPPGHAPGAELPLVLALYGREGDHLRPLARNALAFPYYQARAVQDGSPPFAIATVEAGPTSYWHRRADGTDPASMIVEEYLPLLADRGLAVDRFAMHGDSMGGYGSLLMAARLGLERVAAVAVAGPALFRRYADASDVAFDDEADFRAHDVFAGYRRLAGIPIRIVCGSLDPFYPAVQDFVALPHDLPIETAYAAGCHHVGYWRTQNAEQLRFLTRHLAA